MSERWKTHRIHWMFKPGRKDKVWMTPLEEDLADLEKQRFVLDCAIGILQRVIQSLNHCEYSVDGWHD